MATLGGFGVGYFGQNRPSRTIRNMCGYFRCTEQYPMTSPAPSWVSWPPAAPHFLKNEKSDKAPIEQNKKKRKK